ncbi:MAG: tetratricopeptide repeat protein [Sandaracinaceae bacterium]
MTHAAVPWLVAALWVVTPVGAVAQPSTAPDAHLEEGRSHWRAGRYTASAAAYRRATRAAPDDARAFAGLARAYVALGAFPSAEPAYRRAILLSTSPPAALSVAYGDCLAQLGDRNGAAAAYLAALERDPTHEPARLRLVAPVGSRTPARPQAVRVEAAPSGIPLLVVGVTVALVGLATGLGCGIAYALEADEMGSGLAGTDPLTWAGCIGTGAVLLTAGLSLAGTGFAVGVSHPTAATPTQLRVAVAPAPMGARVQLQLLF